jgi:carbonic anhydrase/acetyltransferase-like protein (isoleucine patch superfamily)
LDGAVIGKNSVIGPGSLIPKDVKIPPGEASYWKLYNKKMNSE